MSSVAKRRPPGLQWRIEDLYVFQSSLVNRKSLGLLWRVEDLQVFYGNQNTSKYDMETKIPLSLLWQLGDLQVFYKDQKTSLQTTRPTNFPCRLEEHHFLSGQKGNSMLSRRPPCLLQRLQDIQASNGNQKTSMYSMVTKEISRSSVTARTHLGDWRTFRSSLAV